MAQLQTATAWGQLPAEHPIGIEVDDGPRQSSAIWVQVFIGLVFLCQVCLLFPSLGPLRIIFRSLSFGSSLLFLMAIPGSGLKHPSAKALILVPIILVFSFMHPDTAGFVAGVASVALYIAILGPVFWVSRLRIDVDSFRRIILTLWLFNLASSFVGVLQVYYPGRFESEVSITMRNAIGLDMLKITLPNGDRIFRPMGLTDSPGGAAQGALYSVIFGMGLLLNERKTWRKAAFLFSMFVGFFCLYLCQVRSSLVMAIIAVFTFIFVLARRGEVKRMGRVIVIAASAVFGGFVWALAYGGASVTERLATLFASNPLDVYNQNRGGFVVYTITDVMPTYPFGAGLARWGMIYQYFGQESKLPPLWSEIIWTGWVYDGGIPMLCVYATAMILALRFSWKLSQDKTLGALSLWAALVFAYDIGTLALCFNTNLFVATTGMEYWVFNACLFAAYIYAVRHPESLVEVPV
jgi:hypothetical protein